MVDNSQARRSPEAYKKNKDSHFEITIFLPLNET
jgi:hypothetical protein